MDDEWYQFLNGALDSASLGFLRSPQRGRKTFDPNGANALRLALAQHLGSKLEGRRGVYQPSAQRSTFGDGFVDGMTLYQAPRQRSSFWDGAVDGATMYQRPHRER